MHEELITTMHIYFCYRSQIPEMGSLIEVCSTFTCYYAHHSWLQDVVKLTDKLLEVCNKKVEAQRFPALLTMDKVCRSLGKLTNAE